MKELKILLVNNLPYESRLFIDGKEQRYKKNKRGVSEIRYQTDKDTAKIRVANFFDGQLPFWKWFWQTVMCWVLSVFGIFDSVENPKGRTVDFEFDVNAFDGAFVKIKFNLFKKDAHVAEVVDTNAEIVEIANRYFVDKTAQKRSKIYKIWRIISAIVFIFGIIIILILRS